MQNKRLMVFVFTILTLLTRIAFVLSDEMPVPRGAPEEKAIRDRIWQAQKEHNESSSSRANLERDIVLFADFEQDNMIFQSDGGFFHVTLPKDHYRPGRHGRGFFFEKPGDNQLPQHIADVETDMSGFQSINGAELKSVDEQTICGKKALGVKLPATGTGFRTTPVKTTYAIPMTGPHAGKTWRLLASCYVKGSKGAKVRIEVTPIQKEADKVSEKDRNDTKGTALPLIFHDKITPQQIVLSGEWQRIACDFALDVSKKDVMASFSLVSQEPAEITLLANGFQFEESLTNLVYDCVPTTWIPGGTRRAATPIRISSSFSETFPIHEGSIVYWIYEPADSNLKGPNGGPVLSFGDKQWANGWQVGPQFRAGGDDLGVGVGYTNKWQHIAMTWDENKASVYLDGKLVKEPLDRKLSNLAVPPGSVFMIGGSIQLGQYSNAILDDVGVFKRKLTNEEIMSLAEEKLSLHGATNDILFEAIGRTVFYRDENRASFDFRIKSLQERETPAVEVDFCIGEAIYARQSIKLDAGMATARFEFSPSQLKSGHYVVRLASPGKRSNAYWETSVDIVPTLRTDHYMLSTWGSGIDSQRLNFYKKIGLNTVDTWSPVAEQVGREGFLYGWHYDQAQNNTLLNADVWKNIYVNQETAKEVIRDDMSLDMTRRVVYPNWKYVLINSERGLGAFPDEAKRHEWYDAWAEKEFGFHIPQKNWTMASATSNIAFWFPEDRKPGNNGVFTPSRELAFLKWWLNHGSGMARLNAMVAGIIQNKRPDVKVWTDPLEACPKECPGQIAGLSAGGTWCYDINSETMIGDFEEGSAVAHGSGKEFFCTLGMWYYFPVFAINVPIADIKQYSTENQFAQMLIKMSEESKAEKNSKETVPVPTSPTMIKVDLAPTGDDMIQQAWIAVGYIPSDGLAYWFLDGLFHGLNRDVINGSKGGRIYYAESGSDERLANVLKNDLLPIGTMLKNVPNAPRPIALFHSQGTQWASSGEGKWNYGPHYINQWKLWLGTMGIPYDFVFDHTITPGSLAKYQAVIFPGAQYVEERIYKELQAAGNSGTKIIVDKYCRQDYPNMEKWDQRYLYWRQLTPEQRKVYDKATLEPLEALRKTLLPKLDAYAVGQEGPVLLNVREYHGAKYVVVINNNRQSGQYTQWTKDSSFKPYGKAQKATVYLNVPTDSVIYDFIESRQLPVKVIDNHLVAEITLPAHAGRLLCVYPKAFNKITISPPDKAQVGIPNTIGITLLDHNGAVVKGRQLVSVRVLDPAGKEHDETGIYTLEDAKATIPFRPALNDVTGQWRIEVFERTSGLKTNHVIEVY